MSRSLQKRTLSPINERDAQLLTRVWAGHCEAVREALAQGANLNVESDGKTPLYHAIHQGHLALAEMLLEIGADPNAGTAKPLLGAAIFGRTDIIVPLIDHGASLLAARHNGRPICQMAIANLHIATAYALLEAGDQPPELSPYDWFYDACRALSTGQDGQFLDRVHPKTPWWRAAIYNAFRERIETRITLCEERHLAIFESCFPETAELVIVRRMRDHAQYDAPSNGRKRPNFGEPL